MPDGTEVDDVFSVADGRTRQDIETRADLLFAHLNRARADSASVGDRGLLLPAGGRVGTRSAIHGPHGSRRVQRGRLRGGRRRVPEPRQHLRRSDHAQAAPHPQAFQLRRVRAARDGTMTYRPVPAATTRSQSTGARAQAKCPASPDLVRTNGGLAATAASTPARPTRGRWPVDSPQGRSSTRSRGAKRHAAATL